MDTKTLKKLLLECEQEFLEALARCRTEELKLAGPALDKVEQIFQNLLDAQGNLLDDVKESE